MDLQALVSYYRVLNPNETIDDNISFHDIFFKVHEITYDQYI